jgi:uncharacterized protein YceK
MTGKTLAACVTALALSALVGCGTMTNIAAAPDKPTPLGTLSPQAYGGVRVSGKMVVTYLQPDPNPVYRGFIFRSLGCASAAWMLFIDAPLSFVGDTLTLPYTLNVTASEEQARQSPGRGVTPIAPSQPASP